MLNERSTAVVSALGPPPDSTLSPEPTVPLNLSGADEADDTAWAERGDYWGQEADQPQRSAAKGAHRTTEASPLILSGHGVGLQVQRGALLVQDGFTHHPQTRRQWRLFPSDRDLPSRIIVLGTHGGVSFEVLAWLAQRDIPLVLLDWQGSFVGVAGAASAPHDSHLRVAQVAAQETDLGLRIATRLIAGKVAASLVTLAELPVSIERSRAWDALTDTLAELSRTLPASPDDLRLIEGRAALAYFRAWGILPLKWKGTGRRPIPDEWHTIGPRQSSVSGTNRHATHPVNAVLNYAYGVLEAQVRRAAAAEGLDPECGWLHVSRAGRAAAVYDMMEPLRPAVDAMVLRFVAGRVFSPADFQVSRDGVCTLHPQLARAVAGLSVSDQDVRKTVRSISRMLMGESTDLDGLIVDPHVLAGDTMAPSTPAARRRPAKQSASRTRQSSASIPAKRMAKRRGSVGRPASVSPERQRLVLAEVRRCLANGWNLSRLAAAAGIHRANLHAALAGHRALSEKQAEALSRVFALHQRSRTPKRQRDGMEV